MSVRLARIMHSATEQGGQETARLISRACCATPLMDEVKQYKTAGAFRTALETRLQNRAQEERTDLQRLRRQVAFDRFLARLFPKESKGTYPWILKGGYAMELRIRSARTTKDIDLTLHDGTHLGKDPERRRRQVRAMVQDSAAIQLKDYFEFL